MKYLKKLIKADKRHEILLGIVFVMYIILNVKTPTPLAKFIDTHSYEREFGSKMFVMGIDNEKYLNHSADPSVNDDGIALKDIKIGDEITIDYRDFDDSMEAWLT